MVQGWKADHCAFCALVSFSCLFLLVLNSLRLRAMGRTPCCSGSGLLRGPWTDKEDELLIKYIQANGEGHWRSLPRNAGLLRCGKSCRQRWRNYLRPDIKRGNITPEEDDLIIRLHTLLGNRWSLIAGRFPGRTDNEIKNYWNHHLSRRIIGSAKAKSSTEAPKCMITRKLPIEKKKDTIDHGREEEMKKTRVDLHLFDELKDGEQALVYKKQDCFVEETKLDKLYEEYQKLLDAEDNVQLDSC